MNKAMAPAAQAVVYVQATISGMSLFEDSAPNDIILESLLKRNT